MIIISDFRQKTTDFLEIARSREKAGRENRRFKRVHLSPGGEGFLELKTKPGGGEKTEGEGGLEQFAFADFYRESFALTVSLTNLPSAVFP
jgi:hypothetical protein